MHEFVSAGAAKLLTLVWLVVCSVVMRVHYRLFKHGTWLTHRKGIRCNVFEFSRRSPRNPVISSLSDIASMLLDPLGSGRQHLELVRLRFGEDLGCWPRRLVTALDVSLSLAGARDALAENLSVL